MYQTLVKIIQIAIVAGAVYVHHTGENTAEIPLGTAIFVGVILAFIVTVVPWLIFLGCRDIYRWFRAGMPRKPRDPDAITLGDISRWIQAGQPAERDAQQASSTGHTLFFAGLFVVWVLMLFYEFGSNFKQYPTVLALTTAMLALATIWLSWHLLKQRLLNISRRVDPRVTKPLQDGISRRWIGGDRRPRIGQ